MSHSEILGNIPIWQIYFVARASCSLYTLRERGVSESTRFANALVIQKWDDPKYYVKT
jgi:hypothetical protein